MRSGSYDGGAYKKVPEIRKFSLITYYGTFLEKASDFLQKMAECSEEMRIYYVREAKE